MADQHGPVLEPYRLRFVDRRSFHIGPSLARVERSQGKGDDDRRTARPCFRDIWESSEVGHFVLQAVDEVKSANPKAVYCCDPAMGDYGKGVFASEGIPDFISALAVPSADIVTPNQFEAELISGSVIAGVDDAKAACEIIHGMGPSIVLITSFKPYEGPDKTISVFMSSQQGFYILSTPELSLDLPPSGAGDLAAALFLARYLPGRDPVLALESMMDSVFSIFERSRADGASELSIIPAQEAIANPRRRFEARKV